jgi:short-subunit dehydrogenase
MDFTLEAQVAVITGASSGIGRALAMRLGEAGVQVCLLGRDKDRLRSVSKEVSPNAHTHPIWYALDLTADPEITTFASWLRATLGKVHILVHGAGTIDHGTVAQSPVEAFDAQYRVNVRAPFVLTQALLPFLIESGGQVVFVNSSAGLTGKAGASQYSATKHALRGLADSLREEVNALGVRVLSLYPGRTATPMQAAVHAVENREYRPERLLQPADIAEMVVRAVLLPPTAEVTDIHIRPRLVL